MWRVLYFVVVALSLVLNGKDNFLKPFPILLSLGVFVFLLAVEIFVIRKMSLKVIIASVIGGGLGICFAMFTSAFILPHISDSVYIQTLSFFVCLYLSLGTSYAVIPKIGEMSFKMAARGEKTHNAKILDTSVIVDGRILDIAETGFIDGVFIVPEFVLKEIQLISDSRDPQKRIRGRRALDVLNKMKSSKNVPISIVDRDFPSIPEVDLKLIELAKELNAKVVTNDYNLNKVASIQEVPVLNVNDLAKTLTPVVMPNDSLVIELISEGQEKGQAIGHLEDGTMVVVDNARNLIGREVEVKISRFHQTAAGRMIFADVLSANPKNPKARKRRN